MKDYKLSELKEICKKHCVRGNFECESESCPICNECVSLGNDYFADLNLEKTENNNDNT